MEQIAQRGLAGLRSLAELSSEWNGPNSTVPDEAAKSIVFVMLSSQPWVTPCNDGSIQLEWHEQGWDIEFVVSPDGTIDGMSDRAEIA